MPDEVRESLAEAYPLYLLLAEAGKKGPTPRQLSALRMLNWLYGEEDMKE
jgi:hypothetical protein